MADETFSKELLAIREGFFFSVFRDNFHNSNKVISTPGTVSEGRSCALDPLHPGAGEAALAGLSVNCTQEVEKDLIAPCWPPLFQGGGQADPHRAENKVITSDNNDLKTSCPVLSEC